MVFALLSGAFSTSTVICGVVSKFQKQLRFEQFDSFNGFDQLVVLEGKPLHGDPKCGPVA